MQTEITLKEFKLFLKKNIKLIAITSILFLSAGMLLVGYQEFRSTSRSKKVKEVEEITISNEELEYLYNTDPEELTMQETELLNDYLMKDAYYFTVLIEEPDYSPYNRANLLHAFLMSDQVISQLEEELGKEIQPSPEQAVRNSYDQSNVLHTFAFTTGNKADNEVLANAVYDLIINKELPILAERYVYPKDGPALLDLETEEQAEMPLEIPESDNSMVNILLAGIVSLILGLIFGVIFAFARERFSYTIGYLYSYPVDKEDLVMRYEKGTDVDDESVLHVIKTPAHAKKAIILEDRNQIEKMVNQLNGHSAIHFISSVAEMDPSDVIEEAILLVNVEETTKEWLNRQLNILEIYDVRKKILIVDV